MIQKSIFLLLIIVFLIACNNTKSTTKSVVSNDLYIELNFLDDSLDLDSVTLFQWDDIQVVEHSKTPVIQSDGAYLAKFQFRLLPAGMYYVGKGLNDMKPFLIASDQKIIMKGSVANFNEMEITDSPLNLSFYSISDRIKKGNQRFMSLITKYNNAKSDQNTQISIAKELVKEDKWKMELLDSLRSASSYLSAIMAFNCYQSFQNNAADGQSEGDYFANTFFQEVDFSDSTLCKTPFYYENVKNYANALTKVGLDVNRQLIYIDTLFGKIATDNKNHRSTLVGVVFGMMGANNKVFSKYGKSYLDLYEGVSPPIDQFIRQKLAEMKGPAGIGDEAPDIIGKTPDDKTMSLKDLRGKVVLIDFWASWCGPCRRENPNVVKVYNAYKDKGFDVLGVSLDTNKDKWVAAIASDQLSWHHVSDLKGWSSALSKPYGVRGIPHTVLVDKKGEIIATKLRGNQLEAKLKEIFGS